MVYTDKQEQDWKSYENVRLSGEFNMITQAYEASSKAGLSIEDYKFVIKNYCQIREQILSKNSSIASFMARD